MHEDVAASPLTAASRTSSLRDTAPEITAVVPGRDSHREGTERSSYFLGLFPSLPLPQAPANLFARDAVINELSGLVERFASFTLLGAGGIGKSAVALTLLHHDRISARFGKCRHFIRCDDLVSSLDGFIGRLSDAIGARYTTDMSQLRSHLTLSPPRILVLDGVESILDPLAPGAVGIATAIEEFGRCQNVCVLATSRMHVEIPGFRCVEIPTLPENGAQDTFYGRCHLTRSSRVDKLLAELDFHPLSVGLLAAAVRENSWDEPTLLKAWGEEKTGILTAPNCQSLESNIKSILHTPTIQELGPIVREMLDAIAVYPRGVKECRLESMFPGTVRVSEAVNVLCKFSLVYRQDGFVKMLSPFRFYFSESPQSLVYLPGGDATHSLAEENIDRKSVV